MPLLIISWGRLHVSQVKVAPSNCFPWVRSSFVVHIKLTAPISVSQQFGFLKRLSFPAEDHQMDTLYSPLLLTLAGSGSGPTSTHHSFVTLWPR